ncbi:MAG: sigma-54-dependent Fis family transcriptional regulator [Spirochaetales bacterium]|nr:sigma-54-dependent Fis family transcriptional regulator [Spirochaetales bacterium]
MSIYPPFPLLIVDDEKDVCQSYCSLLADNGITNVITCIDSRKLMNIIGKQRVSLIILDLMMPFLSGHDLLSLIRKEYPEIPVIIVTASEEIGSIARCLKIGVYDYVIKPVDDMRLVTCIKHAFTENELKQDIKKLNTSLLETTLHHPHVFSGIITNSESMKRIFRYIEAIASSPKPVLITGESGTGKELIARAIHYSSGRTGNFVPVNISGLDEVMFSDTIFGHTKGAFTGASETRKGLIEKASGGTIFLDEIGDLQPASQIKLLRLLQENEYYMLGSDVIRTTTARMIFATNTPLDEKQLTGNFRKDLYYRLMTHNIKLPPLRKRSGDIPVLLRHFVGKAASQLRKQVPEIPEQLYFLLEKYPFPGNIRELEAMVTDAVSVNEEPILPVGLFCDHISDRTVTPAPESYESVTGIITISGKLPKLKDVERYLINRAMKQTNGNMTAAARLVGISPATMLRRIKEEKERDYSGGLDN